MSQGIKDIPGRPEIRPAREEDLSKVERIYSLIHSEEEAGRTTIGWKREIYPTRQTAEAALKRGDLYVLEAEEKVLGAGIINRQQVDVYVKGHWLFEAGEEEVLVLHTLVISPQAPRRGLGRAFVGFYEEMARKLGCKALRIDTNARNQRARAMYKSLGYREADVIPCTFQGLEGIDLVLLEKKVD